MKILLNVTCMILLSCMMVEINASMENFRKSSRIANLPARNVIYDQIDSDDEVLNLKLPVKRKKFKQDAIMTDVHNEKTTALRNENSHVYPQSLQDPQFPVVTNKKRNKYLFYSMSQASLNKVWNHPSVQQLTLATIERKDVPLTLDEIERKAPYSEDSPVTKKSKKSQNFDDYSSDSYKSDENLSDQDESALLENYIFYDNNQNLPVQQPAAVDYVGEHNDENFDFDSFYDDLIVPSNDKIDDIVAQSSESRTDFNKSSEHVPVVDALPEQSYEEELLLHEYLDSLSPEDIEPLLTINNFKTNDAIASKRQKQNLTQEQINACSAIKNKVLQDTGDTNLATKAYKSMYNKFYQSTDEYKNYKRNYFKTYTRPDKK